MARPGRPKKPSALEALQGYPGHRPPNRDEPKPSAVTSSAPPAWLKGEARNTWLSHAPELHRLGLLTVLDVQVLAGACRWWAIYRQADRVLSTRGLITTSPSNGRQPAPEIAIAYKAYEAATKVFDKFGITPSERERLHAPQPKGITDGGSLDVPKDPHDELAARRRARAITPDSD